MHKRLALFSALLTSTAGCEPGSTPPVLGEVLGAVDARRAMECAEQAVTDPKAAAKCLGVSLLDDALRLALNKAADLARTAQEAAGPAGADDMSDEDRAKLAADLDDALAQLAHEIAERG